MPEKKERDYVNPKRLLREIMKSLPAEEYVRSTVAALWMFCNDYIEKDDIANGTVRFSGTVSYSQLAEVLAIGESTGKWRMNRLRDEFQLVEWERTKFGIKFTFGVPLSANGARHQDAEQIEPVGHSANPAGSSRPVPRATYELDVEAFRLPSTPAQQACDRSAGHTWTDYLHTTEQCSNCGKFRTNPKMLEWTAADDLEAEYMAWVEEDAPDYWDPFATLLSVGGTDAHGDSTATLSDWEFDREIGGEPSRLIIYLNPAL
jgi:hypothetical protein